MVKFRLLLFCLPAIFSSPAMAFTLAEVGFEEGWGAKTVEFYYNETNCPATVTDAMDKAFELWSSVPSSKLKIKLAGPSTTTPTQLLSRTAVGVPVIVCDPNFETNSPGVNGNYVGGYGFFTHASGKIDYGGIVLSVQTGKLGNINNYSATSLAILMAHEMGHVLGLGHSEFHPALMYYDISSKTELNLSQDDVDGISYLYPRDEVKDGLYGCARTQSLPPATGAAALICLLFPLLCLAWLRRKSAASYAAA